MLARAVEAIPEVAQGEMWFEPKWDGFRAVIFRDGADVEIGSRNERPLTRYLGAGAGHPSESPLDAVRQRVSTDRR